MTEIEFETRQCSRESCRFRYPVVSGDVEGLACPRCGAPAELANVASAGMNRPLFWTANGQVIVEGFLDNIRSAYNVGAIFRTADGAGIRHLHLAGITPTPDHPKVGKTALGSEKVIPWTHHRNGLDAIVNMRDEGYELWALENRPDACSIFEYPGTIKPDNPILLIVGNELAGIDGGILDLCHRILALPMVGSKGSLNVEVTFGVAAYYLCFIPI